MSGYYTNSQYSVISNIAELNVPPGVCAQHPLSKMKIRDKKYKTLSNVHNCRYLSLIVFSLCPRMPVIFQLHIYLRI